jgi:hypothetical protein
MSQLFGYSIERAKKVPKGPSFVQKDNQDGATPIAAGGHYGYYVDIDGTVKNEWELIQRYRDMILQPECDSAVDDVVNEAICGSYNDVPIAINLQNIKGMSEKVKKLIREEFDYVLELLDFENKSYEIFRRWYVDGRLFYHKVIDIKDPNAGIIELRYIDPRKIRKVVEVENRPVRTNPNDPQEAFMQRTAEYFIYNGKGLKAGDVQGIKIAPDAITYCHSGIFDMNKNMVLSHLHKAIKAVNQLRMIEDSLVIYRLSRAPERRIFYIDVGNLPKIKAEQYLREVMSRYRNKLVYDANTGEIKDDRKFMSMLEDFWLPRREGGRGTEITTLPGGQNLGELEDVKYFQKKLYKSLNVPNSRLETETTFNIGRSTEITRDELKFQKFINRLRKRFSDLFQDILKTQLLLKGVITVEDWDQIKNHIQYDFIADNYFNELKGMEMMNERMNLVATMDPFIGKYFSIDHIRRNVLKQTEEEYKEIDEQIEKEMADGKIADPNAMVDPATGMPMDGGAMPPEAGAAGGALPPEEGGAQVGEGGVEPDPKDLKKAEF